MPKYIDRDFLRLFAHEVIRDVAVQTHTDFSKFLKPVIDRWEIELKIRNDQAIKLAKKEALDELVNKLPVKFWEDEDHSVGGYISKKDLKELLK